MDFGGFSVELCGGTHVHSTGEIGLFKITIETSVASGIRRMEAVTGEAAIDCVQNQEQQIKEMATLLNAPQDQVGRSIEKLLEQNKQLQKQIDQLNKAQANESVSDVFQQVSERGGIHYLSHVFEETDTSVLRDFIDGFKGKYTEGVVVFGNVTGDKAQVLVGVTKATTKSIKAGELIKNILAKVGGRGGGRPDFAQGGGVADKKQLEQAIDTSIEQLQSNI
jgi:alanyl-tRNA synthetase